MSDKQEGNFTLSIGEIKGEQVNTGQNVTATQNIYGKDRAYYDDEVLHIIGETVFGQVDAKSLKDAGVKTKVVQADVAPYSKTLIAELERQRSDGNVSKLWHISSHGDATKGLLFGKQWVSWQEFQNMITPYDELEVLFIAACSTVNVADAVVGGFNYVLACAVDIPNDDAAKATRIFWHSITNGKTAEEAFDLVKLNIPTFAPHIRLRGSR